RCARHVHAHNPGLPNRASGYRADRRVRWRAGRRRLGRIGDGVHASLVAREDVRGREVRARLLADLPFDLAVLGFDWLVVLLAFRASAACLSLASATSSASSALMLSPIDSMSGRASKSPSRPKFISPA